MAARPSQLNERVSLAYAFVCNLGTKRTALEALDSLALVDGTSVCDSAEDERLLFRRFNATSFSVLFSRASRDASGLYSFPVEATTADAFFARDRGGFSGHAFGIRLSASSFFRNSSFKSSRRLSNFSLDGKGEALGSAAGTTSLAADDTAGLSKEISSPSGSVRPFFNQAGGRLGWLFTAVGRITFDRAHGIAMTQEVRGLT
eukprot:TRINITY_DN10628_c0_g1_i1.p2 TRINITY_DN10628_c0_g1~~TRINITY_DN10628_c0_g1_i1.p2  ORF type:complete len:203 (-),score=28.98 TRINITY_DN10628_c0_g1_i1:33-641(-)